jgi:hypothetical protein
MSIVVTVHIDLHLPTASLLLGSCTTFSLREHQCTLRGYSDQQALTGNYLEDTPSGYVALGVYRTF